MTGSRSSWAAVAEAVPARRFAGPRAPGWVLPRERIVAKVLATPAGAVCALSSAPGYGRTTVLRMAAERSDQPTLAVGLTRADTGIAAFWSRLLAALRSAGVPADAVAGKRPGSEVFLRRLVDLLAAGPPLRLVVDDVDERVHVEVMSQLGQLAEVLPAPTTLTLALRRAVPGDLARLRTSGRLCTVEQGEFVLSEAEAETLVRVLAPDLPAARRRRLVQAAEGWPAALTAAARATSPDGGDDPLTWLVGPGVELLFEPLLAELPADDADFLVACSILRVLTPQACDAVWGSADSGRRLAAIESARCFVQRTSIQPTEYRVHGLFAEFLRRRLAQRGETAERAAHLAAGRWFAERGDAEEAIGHLVEAGAYPQALGLLEAHLEQLLNTGRAEAVQRAYGALGARVTRHHLHLLGAAWSSLLAGDPSAAAHAVCGLDQTLADLRASPRVDAPQPGDGAVVASLGWLTAETELLHAYISGWQGFPQRMESHAQAALGLYGEPGTRMGHQLAPLLVVRSRLWRGDSAGAGSELTAARDRPGLREHFRRVGYLAAQAWLAQQQGRAHRARFLADEVLDWLAAAGTYGATDRLESLLARGGALLDLDQLDAAETDARQVVAEGDRLRHVSYGVLGRLTLAAVFAARLQPAAGLTAIGEARDLIQDAAPGSALLIPLLRVEARMRLDARDAVRVGRLVRQLPHDTARHLLQVRLAQLRRPGSGVGELLAVRSATPREATEVGVLLAGALVHARPREAEQHLLAAADVAEDMGLRRCLAGCSAELFALAKRLARRSGHDGLAAMLPAGRSEQEAAAGDGASSARFSPGELELIALLPTRLSNADLAAELSVSVNTVKTRLRRLYRKLSVHDRGEAVRRAGELRLLPPEPR